MIEAATAAVAPDALSAQALTESYRRLWSSTREMVELEGLLPEFDRVFPPLEVAGAPTAKLAGRSGLDHDLKLEAAARQATTLLAQMSGWLDGLIQEQTLDRQIQANAEAYADLQTRPAMGFSPPTATA